MSATSITVTATAAVREVVANWSGGGNLPLGLAGLGGTLEHDRSSWNQLDPSCLLQHATPVRANAMRWNHMRFHLIAFRAS
jgi:hypothetical protein